MIFIEIKPILNSVAFEMQQNFFITGLIMTQIKTFIRKNTVFCIATLAALVTCFFIPPSQQYLGYFDIRTLTCLFITLAIVCALKNIQFFLMLARKVVSATGSLRMLSLALVYITFLGSLLIANDMALITFLPLSYFAFKETDNEKHMAYIFILQNISANLGGMLTPFGNPQNLYLYSYFNIDTGDFIKTMFPPFLLAVSMLTISCFFLPKEKLKIKEYTQEKTDKKKTVLYLILFAFSILIVLRIIPYIAGLVLIPCVLLITDRKALKMVDYSLLMTFVMFFIFSGNMARIEPVSRLMSHLLDKNTLVFSVASCQFISNVPSAILLSRFTSDYHSLLLGVNIGGTGTLIASLASLITFRHYKRLYPQDVKKYIAMFTYINVIFLVILTAVSYFFFI